MCEHRSRALMAFSDLGFSALTGACSVRGTTTTTGGKYGCDVSKLR
jgi:hypothetical protein